MAHDPLITRAEAPQFGVSADFLAQFDLRAIEVGVVTAGALGTAAFKWRPHGETTWSATAKSSSRAPWTWTPGGAFAAIAFAAGTYATTATYTIDEDGTVTRSGTGPDTITATRWDVVANAISALTEEATGDLLPRRVLPLLSWGDATKRHAAAWLKYLLKLETGSSPSPAATGDESIRLAYEDARLYFRRAGQGDKCPPDMVDSSANNLGAGLIAEVVSEDVRGWDAL